MSSQFSNMLKVREAPTPKGIPCERMIEDCPSFYGSEYHGAISHKKANQLIQNEGEYLIRLSPGADNFYTLSLRICDKVSHFKLFYKEGRHYIKENSKSFETVKELVFDGLMSKYVDVFLNTPCLRFAPEDMSLDGFSLKKGEKSCDEDQVTCNKSHVFKLHAFKGFNWCEFCGNFLWGFGARGVKCADCGFSAHYKCSEKVSQDCFPDFKRRGVFGVNLTEFVKAHGTKRPFIIDKCVGEIEARGLEVEGLYRMSGYKEDMEHLKWCFDKDGIKVEIGCDAYENIHVISGVLKMYLRSLPVPLVTYNAYTDLIKDAESQNILGKISQVKTALAALPEAHYNTLKYLIEHLNRVSKYSHLNKMTAVNLSTVFTPSIMPPHDAKNVDIAANICKEIEIVQILITYHQVIF